MCGGGGGGGADVMHDTCLCRYAPAHASNWSGRTPESQTPGVPATPSPRQRRTLRHRGLKNGHSRPCGRSAKKAAKMRQNHPSDSEDLVDEPQLRTATAETPRNSVLSEPRHLSLKTTGVSTTKPRTERVRSSRSAAQFAL